MGTLSVVCILSLIVASISSLPLRIENDYVLPKIVFPEIPVETTVQSESVIETDNVLNTETITSSDVTSEVITKSSNVTLRNNVRPGMVVNNYDVKIIPHLDSRTFEGRLIAQINLIDPTTREDPIILLVEDLTVHSVEFALGGSTIFSPADFFVDQDDGFIEIFASETATSLIIMIEYEGIMDGAANGMFAGSDGSYIGMNLHPTHARRVFPCIDEPIEPTIITFTFDDVPFSNVVVNSMLEEGSSTDFRALQGPPHLWGMIAHDFVPFSTVMTQVRWFGRIELRNQDTLAGPAISDFFRDLEEWTDKSYFDIIANQNEELVIVALPDTNVDWYALSSICIWEPNIFAEQDHSMKQRKTVLTTLAESMARQWFGYAVYPENWRHQWVTSGLATHAAYEVVKKFQESPFGNDPNLLDMNTLFVTDVIQESLLRDGYANAHVLYPDDDLHDEDEIRDHINGLQKWKAPAIMRMLRLVLGREDDDFIRTAGAALLRDRALQTVTTLMFYDAINGYWLHSDNKLIGDIEEFLEPWIMNRGYPLIFVGLRQGGIHITQEHFSFTPIQRDFTYEIPVTFTTSVNPNFDDENVYNIIMMDNPYSEQISLDEDDGDFVLFNLQGQGYYRVMYDDVLYERIIDALNDPDRREEIHPLNRGTLIDDALNLARSGRVGYDIAFEIVLAMEHETEYAPWKAFVRNMDFLRKRLVAMISEDEDLDPDIYLRMVRRTIHRFEDEIGFYPDPQIIEPAMVSLTRGLVMDHACRANYQPCIAAAVDWFYDPDSGDPVVNPDIPSEIRPAVYCTMVREGDQAVINALYDRLEIEQSTYERVVILESLACSRDAGFIGSLLTETITVNSDFGVEERNRIFTAVAESSYENARLAVNFIAMRTMDMRNTYGGSEKLEQLIYMLADNMANSDLTDDFRIWVNSNNNNLDDSQDIAERARDIALENLDWDNRFLENVYEWIDDNDAPTLVVSLVLICVTFVVTLFNH